MRRPWLAPLTPLYAAGLAFRDICLAQGWEHVHVPWYPVISVGNLSTGGSGKTPFTIYLARLLRDRGFQIDVLSRGYGRRSKEPALVDPKGPVDQFGDEPLLIARATGVPVYVAPSRYDVAVLADQDFVKAGGELSADRVPLIHILDDGFQHRQLHRDIDILLLNREDWHDRLLPAGNLREPLEAAQRAHIIVVPAEDPGFDSELRASGWSEPVWRVCRKMVLPTMNGPVFAFCGIARPDQFFNGLDAGGLRIAERQAFRDHHRYSAADVKSLAAAARAAGASAFVTTEKDAVRLGELSAAFPDDLAVHPVPLTVEVEDEQAAVSWLEEKLALTHLVQAHRQVTARNAGRA